MKMKRINIYIDESEDDNIDYLADAFDINRSELIRRAIINYVDIYKSNIENFMDRPMIDGLKSSKLLPKYKYNIVDFVQSELQWNTREGVRRVTLRNEQKELLNDLTLYNRVIIRKPRQTGVTYLMCFHALHSAMCDENKNIVMASSRLSLAQDSLSRIYDMVMTLPESIRPTIEQRNKRSIKFENGSTIIASAASPDSVRGIAIHHLYIDECAFINRDIFDEFMKCVIPSMPIENTKIIIASTPNGHNHFHKMFVDALTQYNDFRHVTLRYDIIPGRNKEWRQNEINSIGLKRFKSEYDCHFLSKEDLARADDEGFSYGI
jgi:hypothetical protein